MPNFKVFQDNPDLARIKIYGSQNVALYTDSSGNVAVTAPAEGLSITPPSGGLSITPPANGLTVTAPAEGLSITPPAGGLSITPPTGGLSITPPTAGLAITSTGLAITPPSGGLSITPPSGGLNITPPANGLTVTAPAEGLSITPPAGGLSITPPTGGLSITPPAGGLLITSTGLAVEQTLATTDVSAVIADNASPAGGPADTYNVLSLSQWSLAVVNNSTENGRATVKLQVSPDAVAWNDDSPVVTLNQGDLTTLVANVFLKYARVYYAAIDGPTSAVTLNIYLQGQS
ncbi:MAG: DUF6385 domain-containing protein [Bacillota bacterium]